MTENSKVVHARLTEDELAAITWTVIAVLLVLDFVYHIGSSRR